MFTYNSKVDIHIAASNVVDLTLDCLLCVVLPNRLNPLRCNNKIIIEEDKSISLRAVRLSLIWGLYNRYQRLLSQQLKEASRDLCS